MINKKNLCHRLRPLLMLGGFFFSSIPIVHATPYRYSLATHDIETHNSTIVITSSVGSQSAEALSSGLTSVANTYYSINRAQAESVNAPVHPDLYGAFALSVWRDTITVSGGPAAGVLNVSTILSGSWSGDQPALTHALLHSASSSALNIEGLRSWLDFDTIYQNDGTLTSPAQTNMAFGNWSIGSGFIGTYTAAIPYTRDQPLYLASVHEVSAWGGTSVIDITANFSIIHPANTVINTESGTIYVSPVPEPATSLLFLIGMPTIALFSKRKNKQAE